MYYRTEKKEIPHKKIIVAKSNHKHKDWAAREGSRKSAFHWSDTEALINA